jgi:succinoglycan biosynthesis protein ExoM
MLDQVCLDLTMVICTYHRPDLLTRTLESIACLRDPGGVNLNVLVVDNSDDGNALDTVEHMRTRMVWGLSAIAAHPANISIARNKGIEAAHADIIAFIDDDQQLDPGWLEAVAYALATQPHDVFFGPVEALHGLPQQADPVIERLFSRHVDGPLGHDLFAMGPRQTRNVALGSGNSIFRRSALTDQTPFDPAFGNSGGEDSDLICRLQQRGARLGWIPDARVTEFVPVSRYDPSYLEKRHFAGGQAYALAVSRNSEWPVLARWRQRLIALVQLVLLMPRQLISKRDAAAHAALRYRRASIVGKLSFESMKPIYLQEARSAAAETAARSESALL